MSESALFTAVETDWQNDLQGNQLQLQPVTVDNSQSPGHSARGRRTQASQKRRENECLAEEALTQRNAREEARTSETLRGKAKSGPRQAHIDL